jgi:molecular chaperone GrpE
MNKENKTEKEEIVEDVLDTNTEILEEQSKTTEEIQPEMVEKDKYLRLYSDFENYKRRTLKEKEDFYKTATQKIISDILPTLDNFERAGELEQGIKLIYDNLKNTLEKHGVKEVNVKGEVFNSDTMEALTQIISGEDLKGKVVDVIEKGYEVNGKIFRFAKVVVGI